MFTRKQTCGVCGYRATPTKEEIYVDLPPITERDDADESEVAEDED